MVTGVLGQFQMVLSGSRWLVALVVPHGPERFQVILRGLGWCQLAPAGAQVMICSRFEARRILFCHDANTWALT